MRDLDDTLLDQARTEQPTPDENMSHSNEQISGAAENVQYRVIPAEEITNAQWTICADTFTKHYGVWSSKITSSIGPWTPGKIAHTSSRQQYLTFVGTRITKCTSEFKAQSLPSGAANFLVTAMASDKIPVEPIAHCFVSQWMHGGARVWWITQLVVRSEYRNRKHATRVGDISCSVFEQ